MVDVDGGNETQLTETPLGDEFVPTWSPDGSTLVYDFTPAGEAGDIWVMDADGSNKQQLTTESSNETRPSYSPDGTKILFSSDRDGDNELYVMDSDGTNVQQLTTNDITDSDASWSLDGTQIVFNSARASVIIPDSSHLAAMSVQEVTAGARSGVVRIETDPGIRFGVRYRLRGTDTDQ